MKDLTPPVPLGASLYPPVKRALAQLAEVSRVAAVVGQLGESIAVPELREQAAVIARSVLSAHRDLSRA